MTNEEVEKAMNEALLQEFQEEMQQLQSKLMRDTKWGFIILGCIIENMLKCVLLCVAESSAYWTPFTPDLDV